MGRRRPGPGVVVFPQGGVAPIADQAKADYYDSLHHCSAVVGINTSAQIEAAIVRRPVLTLLDARFKTTQEGTLHFAYLTGTDDAGVLTVARSWDEHLDQLAGAIADPEAATPRLEGFLRAFVRPQGLEEPAAPRAAAAVERTAGARAAQPAADLTRSTSPEAAFAARPACSAHAQRRRTRWVDAVRPDRPASAHQARRDRRARADPVDGSIFEHAELRRALVRLEMRVGHVVQLAAWIVRIRQATSVPQRVDDL